MQEFHNYLFDKSQSFISIIGQLIKLMLGSGVFGLILYFMKLGYYPMGLSVSDSLNFFIISLNFGLLYFFLLLCNFSIGYFIFQFIELFNTIRNKNNRYNFLIRMELFIVREERFNIFLIPAAKFLYTLVLLFLSICSFLFYNIECLSILGLMASGFCTYLLIMLFYQNYSGHVFYGYKGPLELSERVKNEFKKEGIETKNKNLMAFLIVGMCMPLLGYYYDRDNSKLLFMSVKQFTVSQKTKTIFVSKDYIERIPKINIELRGKQDKDYIKLKNTDILVYGLGVNAWVEFYPNDKLENDDKFTRDKKNIRVEIPNEAIYIRNLEVINNDEKKNEK